MYCWPAKIYITVSNGIAGYEIKQGGPAMSLAKIMEKHGEVKPIKKLVEDVSEAACKGIEGLWSEFLEMGDLDTTPWRSRRRRASSWTTLPTTSPFRTTRPPLSPLPTSPSQAY